MTDHYAVLGVSRRATKAQIKDAYRRNARRLHPDVNPDPWAAERFKEMTHAYEVLRDDKSRAEYDAQPVEESWIPPASPDDTSFLFIAKTVVEALNREQQVQMYAGNHLRTKVFMVAGDILKKSLNDYEAALKNPFSNANRPVVLAVAERFLQNSTPTDDIAEQRSSEHLTSGVLGMVGLSRVAQIVGREATPRQKEAAARAVMFALGGALADAGLISLLPPQDQNQALGRAYEYAKSAKEAYVELESVVGQATASS